MQINEEINSTQNDHTLRNVCICFLTWRLLTLCIILFSTQLRLTPHDDPALPIQHPHLELHWDDIKSQFVQASLFGDANWYIGIAKSGYEQRPFSAERQANWAFFPLFPILLKLLTPLTGSYLISGLLISHVCFFLALCVLADFLKKENLPEYSIQSALWLTVFFPTSYFFGAPLTESLFLFLIIFAFRSAQSERPLLGCIFLCLAGTCRPTGIMLLPAYLTYLWKLSPKFNLRFFVPTIITPLGLLAFMYHLQLITGDALAFAHIQSTWDRETFAPLKFFTTYFSDASVLATDWNFRAINICSALLGLWAAWEFLITKRFHWALFVGIPVLTTIFTGSAMSMTRFLSVLFPFYILLTEKLVTPNRERIWFAVSTALLALSCVLYALHITAGMS